MIDCTAQLKTYKLRVTKFRIQLLEIFHHSTASLSNEQIEQALGAFDRITLYRTLKSFEQKGIIHKINFGIEQKWALCPDQCSTHEGHHQHEHIHFRCLKCEEILCIPTEIQQLSIPNFKIETTEINASGICANCS